MLCRQTHIKPNTSTYEPSFPPTEARAPYGSGLDNLIFHTREEFYNYMKQFTTPPHVNQEYHETVKDPFSQEFIPEKVKSDKKKPEKKQKEIESTIPLPFK